MSKKYVHIKQYTQIIIACLKSHTRKKNILPMKSELIGAEDGQSDPGLGTRK